MSSEKLSGVLGEIVFDLLTDIAAGHGDEIIEAPVLDNSIKGLEANCITELIQFWEGKPSVTRHVLFANILKYCSKDIDIISDITAIIIGAYPSNETKLSKNSIMESIKHYYTEVKPVKETPKKESKAVAVEAVEESNETPIEDPIEEEISSFVPAEDKVEEHKVVEKVEHNYMLGNTDKQSDKVREHQEMLEAKRALAAERAALK